MTGEKLLFTLLSPREAGEAPVKTKRYGKWYEYIVGIGNDHVAYVTLTEEAAAALNDLINKEGM